MHWLATVLLTTLFLTTLFLIAIMVGTMSLLTHDWEYRAVHIEGCTPYYDGS